MKRMSERTIQGVSWAWFVFFSQIPFVFWYSQDKPALHPIVVMLPLVGVLNFYVEKRHQEGLGLHLVQPGHSLLFALVYAGLSILGRVIASKLAGVQLQFQAVTGELLWKLFLSFLEVFFIIALWEEIINRGYIQTRLQEAWGFWGVIVTTLLFAVMHVPSALLDNENGIERGVIRFLETGLAGFAFGYVYWRTRSVLTVIAIHGFNNFATTGIYPVLAGISSQQVTWFQSIFQLVWLVGQVGLVLLLSRYFFKSKSSSDLTKNPVSY